MFGSLGRVGWGDVGARSFASSVVPMRRTLPLLLTATLLFAACSSSGDAASDATSVDSTAATDDTATTDPATDSSEPALPPTNPDKPEVEIPDEIPTELQITVIEPGTGPEAQAGDTVIVDYVGVRSRDGVEFDNSYDPRQAGVPASPFTLALGQGSVILVGTRASTAPRPAHGSGSTSLRISHTVRRLKARSSARTRP